MCIFMQWQIKFQRIPTCTYKRKFYDFNGVCFRISKIDFN